MSRRVLRQHPVTRPGTDRPPLLHGHFLEAEEHVLGRLRNKDLSLRRKETVQPLPVVGDYRGSACGRLKESNTGREPGGYHVCTRQVQGEVLRRVEHAVAQGWQVFETLHILWPLDRFGILRSCHSKPSLLPTSGGLDQQPR